MLTRLPNISLSVVLLSLFLLSATSDADDFDRYRVVCQPQQNKIVQAAIDKARTILSKAVAGLPPNDSTAGQRFQKWFGGKEGDYDPSVQGVYAEALGFIGFKFIWCPNASFPGDDPGTLAFVPRGPAPFGEVFVQSEFFNASTSGTDSQAGTIIHELTHLSTRKQITDVVYGPAKAKQLARTRPADARGNADNFEYYAENLADGIP